MKPEDERAEGEEEPQDPEIRLRDYSLMPRLAKPPLAEEKLQQIEDLIDGREKLQGEGSKNSLLGVREVNLKKPLNFLDWKHWYTAISEVSGIGFV